MPLVGVGHSASFLCSLPLRWGKQNEAKPSSSCPPLGCIVSRREAAGWRKEGSAICASSSVILHPRAYCWGLLAQTYSSVLLPRVAVMGDRGGVC